MFFHMRRKNPIITVFKAQGGMDYVIPANNWEYEIALNTWSPCLSQELFPDHFVLNIDGAVSINVGYDDLNNFVNSKQFIISNEFPLPVPQSVGFGLSLGLSGGGIIIIT